MSDISDNTRINLNLVTRTFIKMRKIIYREREKLFIENKKNYWLS